MKVVELIQDLLPWLSGAAFLTKIALSFVIASLAALALSVVWLENPLRLSPKGQPSGPQYEVGEPEVARYDKEWSSEGLEARQSLRNNLRHATAAEDDLPIERIAPGVWGYVHSASFEWGTSTRLQRFPNGSLSFEAHKDIDGTIYLVGFVSADSHRRIIFDNEVHEPATLYSDYWSGAPFIVRVKLTSASGEDRTVSIDTGEHLSAVDLVPRVTDTPADSN